MMRSEIHPIFEGRPDDLFLCCSSFEDRCTHIPRLLSESGYHAKRIVVIRYSGKDTAKEKNLKSIIALLSNVSDSSKVIPDTFDIDDLTEFSEYLADLCEKHRCTKAITIDITTFTKKYLLVMLNILRKELPKATLRLFYTPGIYKVPKRSLAKNQLSWGVKSISILPYLGGMSALESGKKLLVLFLGYERERAWAILNHIEPDKVIAVVANPPTYEGYDSPSFKANARILEEPETETRYVSALEPNDTEELLTQLYKSPLYKNHMLYISPLGTKMETVGIYLFFEKNYPVDRAQVVYAAPVAYNVEKYTFNPDEGEIHERLLFPCVNTQLFT